MGQRDLAYVQRFMAAALQRPDPLGPDVAHDVDALVVPSARGMTPTERLEVYRDQFWQRHLHNLADDFPTLTWALGGADAFTELAREFLLACPPATWDLQRLGAAMPGFVKHQRRRADVVACDAASLDWAFMEIFDAPDAPPFDPRVLASTPEDAWPGARLALHPALRLLPLQTALLEVRDALKLPDGRAPDGAARRETWAAVWRDAACYPRSAVLEAPAFALLVRLSRGDSLGAACEAVAIEHGAAADVEGRVGGWFQDWVQRGWISRVVVAPAP